MSPNESIRASVDAWLRASVENAERRGLPELKPLLEGLAASTLALRSADWNETAGPGTSGEPPRLPNAE